VVLSGSSTTKTGRHDISEILLKVALNTKNQIKSEDVTHTKMATIGNSCFWLVDF